MFILEANERVHRNRLQASEAEQRVWNKVSGLTQVYDDKGNKVEHKSEYFTSGTILPSLPPSWGLPDIS